MRRGSVATLCWVRVNEAGQRACGQVEGSARFVAYFWGHTAGGGLALSASKHGHGEVVTDGRP
jgi:hypothetical protein